MTLQEMQAMSLEEVERELLKPHEGPVKNALFTRLGALYAQRPIPRVVTPNVTVIG